VHPEGAHAEHVVPTGRLLGNAKVLQAIQVPVPTACWRKYYPLRHVPVRQWTASQVKHVNETVEYLVEQDLHCKAATSKYCEALQTIPVTRQPRLLHLLHIPLTAVLKIEHGTHFLLTESK